MASAKQIAANKANAKRSTGPRTPEGKRKASANSIKHGLTAGAIVLPGENVTEFQDHLEQVIDEWQPKSATECLLVERIAVLLCRLRRAPVFEAAILCAPGIEKEKSDARAWAHRLDMAERYRSALEEWSASPSSPGSKATGSPPRVDEKATDTPSPPSQDDLQAMIGQAFITDSEKSDALGKVQRYEANLTNTLGRTMSLLVSLQRARAVSAEDNHD